MRYYLDTEFSERGPGHPIDLISIGIVAQDGREFYAECTDYSPATCNDWVRDNVLPKLRGDGWSRTDIAHGVREFVGTDVPEFWAYYADYDWVVLCQTFGRMVDLPALWPMFCMDIRQVMAERGYSRDALPPNPVEEHNALVDARWVKAVHELMLAARP